MISPLTIIRSPIWDMAQNLRFDQSQMLVNLSTTRGYCSQVWPYFYHLPISSHFLDVLLVSGLEHGFHFSHHIGNVIIPTVTHSIIFQRGRAKNHQFDVRRSAESAMFRWTSACMAAQSCSRRVPQRNAGWFMTSWWGTLNIVLYTL